MKKMTAPNLLAYPLARRIMLIVILWSVLLTVLTSGVQMYLDYRREMNLLEARLQQVEVIEAPNLVNSVWHFDNRQIETQLKGMLNLQDIHYVELRVEGGNTFQAGQMPPAADALSHSYRLEYVQGGETFFLGSLQVVADRRGLMQRVQGGLVDVMLAEALRIFLLAGVILFVVERMLTRPLRKIAHYTESLDLEHLEAPLEFRRSRLATRGDELDQVILKLNEMRLRLVDDLAEQKRMESALRQGDRNYREIFNAVSEAIFICDGTSGRILQVNDSMLRMYGYASEAEVQGKLASDLGAGESPYSRAEASGYLQKALVEDRLEFEWLARRKSGETFWAEVTLHRSSIGGKHCLLAAVRDVTERKEAENLLRARNEELTAQGRALEKAEAEARQLNAELEQRVKERTLQLTVLNQELEAFSYSVAHDLRAPLRHMNGFSQILLEDHGAELSGEAGKWVRRIRESTRNLSEMVDALLSLSRLTRDELAPVELDLSDLAWSVAEDIRQREPERQVEWVIAPGVWIHADRRLVRILLENLLGNAWKFTAQTASGRVELGCLPPAGDGAGEVFFIRDNGAGFDMTFAERLFTPFQRLHTAAEFSGTGIGLATVKRVVQRHGGRVWLESAVGQGTTVYFTLR